MNRFLTLSASCLLAALLAPAAHAQTQGGRLSHLPAGALQRLCQSPQTLKVCDAYVSGMSDGITLVETAAGPSVARDVCVPAPTTAAQMRGVLLGYLSKHSDRLSSDVGPVTYDAFKAGFPCGGAGGGAAGSASKP